MALSFDQIVDRAVTLFGSDNQALIVSFANERQGRMVSESAYLTKVASIGTTAAGTDTYSAPADLIDLRAVRIGSTGLPIPRVSLEDIWQLQNGANLSGADTVFASTFDGSGNPQIVLWPTPGTGGDTIWGVESMHPSDGTYGTSYSTPIPKFLRPYWLDGVLADGYEQIDERPDLAEPHEQRYELGIEKLRRLKNSRVGGPVSSITFIPQAP